MGGDQVIKRDRMAVQAGDYCRLFHKEREGYFSLRLNDTDCRVNSIKESLGTDKIFDKFIPSTSKLDLYRIHIRLNDDDGEKKAEEEHNFKDIFKIENPKLNDGGVVKWSQPIRFKHVGSELYLQVVNIAAEIVNDNPD